DRPLEGRPLVDAAHKHRQMIRGNPRFPQREGGEFTVFAGSASAIDNYLGGVQTWGQHGGQVFVGIVTIEMVSGRNMARLVMAIVARIHEHDQLLLVTWVLEEREGFRTGQRPKPLGLEPG